MHMFAEQKYFIHVFSSLPFVAPSLSLSHALFLASPVVCLASRYCPQLKAGVCSLAPFLCLVSLAHHRFGSEKRKQHVLCLTRLEFLQI